MAQQGRLGLAVAVPIDRMLDAVDVAVAVAKAPLGGRRRARRALDLRQQVGRDAGMGLAGGESLRQATLGARRGPVQRVVDRGPHRGHLAPRRAGGQQGQRALREHRIARTIVEGSRHEQRFGRIADPAALLDRTPQAIVGALVDHGGRREPFGRELRGRAEVIPLPAHRQAVAIVGPARLVIHHDHRLALRQARVVAFRPAGTFLRVQRVADVHRARGDHDRAELVETTFVGHPATVDPALQSPQLVVAEALPDGEVVAAPPSVAGQGLGGGQLRRPGAARVVLLLGGRLLLGQAVPVDQPLREGQVDRESLGVGCRARAGRRRRLADGGCRAAGRRRGQRGAARGDRRARWGRRGDRRGRAGRRSSCRGGARPGAGGRAGRGRCRRRARAGLRGRLGGGWGARAVGGVGVPHPARGQAQWRLDRVGQQVATVTLGVGGRVVGQVRPIPLRVGPRHGAPGGIPDDARDRDLPRAAIELCEARVLRQVDVRPAQGYGVAGQAVGAAVPVAVAQVQDGTGGLEPLLELDHRQPRPTRQIAEVHRLLIVQGPGDRVAGRPDLAAERRHVLRVVATGIRRRHDPPVDRLVAPGAGHHGLGVATGRVGEALLGEQVAAGERIPVLAVVGPAETVALGARHLAQGAVGPVGIAGGPRLGRRGIQPPVGLDPAPQQASGLVEPVVDLATILVAHVDHRRGPAFAGVAAVAQGSARRPVRVFGIPEVEGEQPALGAPLQAHAPGRHDALVEHRGGDGAQAVDPGAVRLGLVGVAPHARLQRLARARRAPRPHDAGQPALPIVFVAHEPAGEVLYFDQARLGTFASPAEEDLATVGVHDRL